MTYKQIEQAREIRLWTTQLLIPMLTTTGLVLSIPGVKDSITNSCKSKINDIKQKFQRKES